LKITKIGFVTLADLLRRFPLTRFSNKYCSKKIHGKKIKKNISKFTAGICVAGM
jgi:hypothetical protein